jgi:hypothetical protein
MPQRAFRQLARERLQAAVDEYDTTRPARYGEPGYDPDALFQWMAVVLGTLSEAARAYLDETRDD